MVGSSPKFFVPLCDIMPSSKNVATPMYRWRYHILVDTMICYIEVWYLILKSELVYKNFAIPDVGILKESIVSALKSVFL